MNILYESPLLAYPYALASLDADARLDSREQTAGSRLDQDHKLGENQSLEGTKVWLAKSGMISQRIHTW